MNLQEQNRIRNFLIRRFTEEELDNEFRDALNYAKDLFERIYNRSERTLENFNRLVISVLMDNLHPLLTIRIGEDVEWYEQVENVLKDYYRDRITRKYNSIYNI